jgi:CheY-like chemotaxis protein
MAKKQIPTAEELREYIKNEEAYLKDCIENNKTFVITGPKFPGESIWKAESTLPLMEAAEEVGTSKEEIWELCSKIASATHAPVNKKEYDIIFLDHMMSGMDGIETLANMKKENMLPEKTRVIALTANAIIGAKELYITSGFDDYLSKPIEVKSLQEMIKENKVKF